VVTWPHNVLRRSLAHTLPAVASIDDVRRVVALEAGLAAVSTVRADGSLQLTVVHAGVVNHPVRGDQVAAFVARGGTRKIEHLRKRPTIAMLWRAGWAWVALDGTCELCGPDDPLDGVDQEGCRLLLRAIATAGRDAPTDWDEYDRVVRAERRTAVLVTPTRIYQNP
jgi:PPOX class probable F420-dependent enzyme